MMEESPNFNFKASDNVFKNINAFSYPQKIPIS